MEAFRSWWGGDFLSVWRGHLGWWLPRIKQADDLPSLLLRWGKPWIYHRFIPQKREDGRSQNTGIIWLWRNQKEVEAYKREWTRCPVEGLLLREVWWWSNLDFRHENSHETQNWVALTLDDWGKDQEIAKRWDSSQKANRRCNETNTFYNQDLRVKG